MLFGLSYGVGKLAEGVVRAFGGSEEAGGGARTIASAIFAPVDPIGAAATVVQIFAQTSKDDEGLQKASAAVTVVMGVGTVGAGIDWLRGGSIKS